MISHLSILFLISIKQDKKIIKKLLISIKKNIADLMAIFKKLSI